ncbi:MAG TPA: hypothetical protein VH040_08170 [Usitatibacter sp.]|jgi:hypothetical protein|nr:hypothetical protein [Usitatibacter sp.]
MLPDDLLLRTFAWDQAKDLAGDKFQVFPEGSDPLVLEVIEVLPGRPGPFTQFSVIFRGPPAPLLPQRTYRFRHERLGDFAILISAVERSAGAIEYEACFAHEA